MSVTLIGQYRVEDFQDNHGEWGCIVTDTDKKFMSVISHKQSREDAIRFAIASMEVKRGERNGSIS